MELVQANEERKLIWEGRSGTLEEQNQVVRIQELELALSYQRSERDLNAEA